MEAVSPSLHTMIFIAIFLVAYIGYLLRNTVRNQLDLHDLLLLSSVAIVPALFVFFSDAAYFFAGLLGVAFPFLILFGALFFLVFICLYRLVRKVNTLTQRNTSLIQEISLLKEEITTFTKSNLL